MNRQFSVKVLVSSALTLGFCLAAGLTVVSCQKQSLDDEPLPVAHRSANSQNWKYLEFTDGFTGVGDISEQNISVVIAAFDRISVMQVDGFWKTNLSSAEEAHVSADVFNYISAMIERKNTKILSALEEMSLTPRTRQVGEVFIEDPLKSNCFPLCIGWIFDHYGQRGMSGADALRNYGSMDGVSSHSIPAALDSIYGGRYAPYALPGGTFIYGDTTSAVILLFRTEAGQGHAVIYTGSSNGNYYYQDPQLDGMLDFTPADSVIGAYQVW